MLQVIRDKRWAYDEYYFGAKDEKKRKNGEGENHWTGAESLECYTGNMLNDTMHGQGEYRWRHKDPDGAFSTYEGYFFVNRLHGYGVMSYGNGKVFTGLYYNDLRWGPGVEKFPSLHSNVGLWRGTQLARLAWRPLGPTAVPDLASSTLGASYLEPSRKLLKEVIKTIGENNDAIQFLKQHGADPIRANKKWTKLYPEHCTDINSVLCNKDLFDYEYYKGKIYTLEESTDRLTEENNPEVVAYYAWNENTMMLHMMKHSYQHEWQRATTRLKLERVLSGPRTRFRPAAEHECNCRTLLMASYTGNIINVTQLVNEQDVYPDIADMKGNTALMYAVCGDQIEVIRFLIEAGASVNACNDSCCTPLGLSLIRYLCVANNVKPQHMTEALIPPPAPVARTTAADRAPKEHYKTPEWHITREADSSTDGDHKSSSRSTHPGEAEYESDEEDEDAYRKRYIDISAEYSRKIIELYYKGKVDNKADTHMHAPFLFPAADMVADIEATLEEMLKAAAGKKEKGEKRDKGEKPVKKVMSKIAAKTSPVASENTDEGFESAEILNKIDGTTCELLSIGADPKLVQSPKPAMLMAVMSKRPEVIRHVVVYGADVNETFPQMLDYTALDLILADHFSVVNEELIRTLLELGADTTHLLKKDPSPSLSKSKIPNILPPPDPDTGPTLLHAVIYKNCEFEFQENIRNNLLDLLLQHRADPLVQYRGKSALDAAMTKKLNLLDVFIKNKANLNSAINDKKQTILMKLFTRDYFQTTVGEEKFPILTNLLLYGADPLIKSYDGDQEYGNVFEFARMNMEILCPTKSGGKAATPKQQESAKGSKSKNDNSGAAEAMIIEYREALNLMTECTRLLHVRWIQAELLKRFINIIHKLKHRHWSIILKDHTERNNVAHWLTISRCFEIWDILATTGRRLYADESILQKALCMLLFYHKRMKAKLPIILPMKAVEKNKVEADVGCLMREHKIASRLAKETEGFKTPYVKPELAVRAHKKFKICFECGLRRKEESQEEITCVFCKLVSFCNMKCVFANLERTSGHPCNDKLIEKYITSLENAEVVEEEAAIV